MALEPFPGYPSLADAIEAAERLTVRWGHDAVRHLSSGQVAAIVSALRSVPSETNAQDAKDAARYRWLISGVSLGKADSLKQSWLRLRGYLHDAQPDPERGWSAGKESFDNLIDGQRNDQPAD